MVPLAASVVSVPDESVETVPPFNVVLIAESVVPGVVLPLVVDGSAAPLLLVPGLTSQSCFGTAPLISIAVPPLATALSVLSILAQPEVAAAGSFCVNMRTVPIAASS